MTRNRFPILFVAISTAAILTACGSSESNSPARSSENSPTSPPAGSPSTVATTASPVDTVATSTSRAADSSIEAASSSSTAETAAAQDAITVSVGSQQFAATLTDTDTARAFADRLPLTLDMHDVNSNEKAFDFPEALPSDPQNPGTINNGDLMLYNSSTLVLFYESFDTSYSYTRIGSLTDPAGLSQALGTGDVTVTFER